MSRRQRGFWTPASLLLSPRHGPRGPGSRGRPLEACTRLAELEALNARLRDSEERLRVLFEHAPDAMYLCDLEGRFLDGNAQAEALTGYKRAELIGKSFLSLDLLAKRDASRARALLAQNAAGRSTGPDEFLLRRKDGSEQVVEIRTHPVTIGGRAAILGIARDATEQRRAEAALREREQAFTGIVDSSRDWIWALDLEGRHTYCNPAVTAILGYVPEELIGLPSVGFLHPDDRHNVEIGLPRRIRAKQGWRDLVLRWRHKDGGYRWLESNAVPILDAAGELIGFRGVDRDISERREAEGRMRRALEGTIQALAETIETRDPYTSGHQKRVTLLAVSIARRLGLSDEQIEGIRVAATLHDIGKVSTPAEILSKPGRLSPAELALIQQHSAVAHTILKGIPFPWPIADIVLQHHERLDGSGYPNQLRGDDILLEARIIAVADTVEAMSSHRPYRPALGVEEALREIGRRKGDLYDGDVVDACVSLWREGGFPLAG